MKPTLNTRRLLTFARWIVSASFWQYCRHHSTLPLCDKQVKHAQLVASWAKADYKAWRAATFQ
jgi:hypothetical protein